MTTELALILSTASFFVVALSLVLGVPLYMFSKRDKELNG